MDTGTLVLARHNTKSTISRVGTPGQNPSLNSILSFKLFHKRDHLSPAPEPPFCGWELILYYYWAKKLTIMHQSCMAELQHRHNNQALKNATVSSQPELLFVDRISAICFAGWPYFPLKVVEAEEHFSCHFIFYSLCRSLSPISIFNFHFHTRLSDILKKPKTIKQNKNNRTKLKVYNFSINWAMAWCLEHTLTAGFV